jgi:hypothetical protein
MMDELISQIMLPSFVCGSIFAVMGAIMYYFPPKKINYLYGYRTGASMRSQERWNFAQKFSALQMIKGGLVMSVLSVLAYVLPIASEVKQSLGLGLVFAGGIYLFVTTERALKKQFTD